jgi:hypothetical protein
MAGEFDNENQVHRSINDDEGDEEPFLEHESAWQQISKDVFVPAEGIALLGTEPAPHIDAYTTSATRRAGKSSSHCRL